MAIWSLIVPFLIKLWTVSVILIRQADASWTSLEFKCHFYMYIFTCPFTETCLRYPIFLKTFRVLPSWILSWSNGMSGKQYSEMQDLDTGISVILVFCPTLLFRVNMYWASTTPYTRRLTHQLPCLFLPWPPPLYRGPSRSSWPWNKDDTHDLWKCRACVLAVERTHEAPRIWHFNRK